MIGVLESVKLSRMNWADEAFAIEGFSPDDRLTGSLDRCGLLLPPWVLGDESETFTIVDGFRRLRWAREKGLERVECLVISPGTAEADLWRWRAEEKILGRSLNTAEKARLISRLCHVLPFPELAGRYLPALGVPPRHEAIEEWRRLASADEGLLQAAAAGAISERAALDLAGWEESARQSMVSFLSGLRCSTSIQVEILERVSEVGMVEGIGKEDVLNAPDLRASLADNRLNHRQKTQVMRDFLSNRLFPRLHARQAHFDREMAGAGLLGGIRVTPPKAFEGERWQMEVIFSSSRELEHLLSVARDFAGSKTLQAAMRPPRSESNS